jgi:hypothetical protein
MIKFSMLKSKIFRMRRVFFLGMFLAVVGCFGGGVAGAKAAIQFDENGKWESSFDCPEWEQNEDGVPALTSGCDDWNIRFLGACGGYGSQVTIDAKNPLSSGARGFRGLYGDGTNLGSSMPYQAFSSKQPELWIRFYKRYQEGFKWDYLNYDKMWRLDTGVGGGNGANTMMHMRSDRFGIYSELAGTSDAYNYNHNWITTFTDNGVHSHGRFICLEMHIKMESGPGKQDGIAQVWIDGQIIVDRKDIQYIANPLPEGDVNDALQGWRRMWGCNQAVPGNLSGPIGSTCAYVDFDDFVIYNQTPPSADSEGNPFIGPIGWGIASEIPGDINKDGIVNIFDYNIFLQHFGVVEDCQNVADLNGDCSVNIFDYNILLQNFGRTE